MLKSSKTRFKENVRICEWWNYEIDLFGVANKFSLLQTNDIHEVRIEAYLVNIV